MKNKIKYALFCLVVLSFSFGVLATDGNPWAQVAGPTHETSQVIGFYTNGCLRGAQELPSPGDGYQTMRPSRRRDFGHPNLIHFIQNLAHQVRANKNLGTLLVGDLAQPRGGPTLSSHASHEVGLDVDIWFFTVPDGKILTTEERENMQAPSMLLPTFESLDLHNWSPEKMELLKAAALQPESQRIFVDPLIKKEVCKYYKGQTWVHKLRPWFLHNDHFHVRILCPMGDKTCESQDEQPDGDGCDSTLDEWLTPQTAAQERNLSAHPSPPATPHLPDLCSMVLNEK